MAIASRLRWFLDAAGVDYEVLPHPHSRYSAETARRSRIPLRRLAKPVLLEDGRGFLLAIVPAAFRVDVERLGRQLGRRLALASEAEVGEVFFDCEAGAIPAIGTPYRVPTVYDESLTALSEVYFEAGDHDDVVHMSGEAYLELLADCSHGRFTRREDAEGRSRGRGELASRDASAREGRCAVRR